MPKETPNETPSTVVAMPIELLQEMIASLRESRQNHGESPSLLKAIEVLSDQQKMTTEQFKRTVRQSNAYGSGISDFTFDPSCEFCQNHKPHPGLEDADEPYGHPRPALKFKRVRFCGMEQQVSQLTIMEIALINQFSASKEARKGSWTAVVENKGSKPTIDLMVPIASHDDLVGLPPFTAIMTELLFGADVQDTSSVTAMILAMQQQIAELQAKLSAVPA